MRDVSWSVEIEGTDTEHRGEQFRRVTIRAGRREASWDAAAGTEVWASHRIEVYVSSAFTTLDEIEHAAFTAVGSLLPDLAAALPAAPA
jgi:hypothetical protein